MSKQDALSAAAHLVQQHRYLYRIDGGRTAEMTPQRAAQYAARYDVIVEPVDGAPTAPDGICERYGSLRDEMPRR